MNKLRKHCEAIRGIYKRWAQTAVDRDTAGSPGVDPTQDGTDALISAELLQQHLKSLSKVIARVGMQSDGKPPQPIKNIHIHGILDLVQVLKAALVFYTEDGPLTMDALKSVLQIIQLVTRLGDRAYGSKPRSANTVFFSSSRKRVVAPLKTVQKAFEKVYEEMKRLEQAERRAEKQKERIRKQLEEEERAEEKAARQKEMYNKWCHLVSFRRSVEPNPMLKRKLRPTSLTQIPDPGPFNPDDWTEEESQALEDGLRDFAGKNDLVHWDTCTPSRVFCP